MISKVLSFILGFIIVFYAGYVSGGDRETRLRIREAIGKLSTQYLQTVVLPEQHPGRNYYFDAAPGALGRVQDRQPRQDVLHLGAGGTTASDGPTPSQGDTVGPPVAALHRRRRSGCPGGAGNFGFNSYDLLTFVLLAFNGMINTINNLNNNNNNNNVNSGNHASETYNEVSSNTDSSSVVVVVVPPIGRRRRRRRSPGRHDEDQSMEAAQQEYQRAVEDTYHVLRNISLSSSREHTCTMGLQVCVYLQEASSRYGAPPVAALQQHLRQEALSSYNLLTSDCYGRYDACTSR